MFNVSCRFEFESVIGRDRQWLGSPHMNTYVLEVDMTKHAPHQWRELVDGLG